MRSNRNQKAAGFNHHEACRMLDAQFETSFETSKARSG
jgi:hypothetical protein